MGGGEKEEEEEEEEGEEEEMYACRPGEEEEEAEVEEEEEEEEEEEMHVWRPDDGDTALHGSRCHGGQGQQSIWTCWSCAAGPIHLRAWSG